MNYRTFLSFSVGGALLWIILLISAGYFFGQIEFVKKNFSVVVLAIIAISILPALFETFKTRKY